MDDLQKLLNATTPGPWVVKFRKDQSAYICMGGTRPGDAHKQFDLLDCDSESDLADVRLLGLAKALACQVIAARKLVEAARLARRCHGVMLMTHPPQDPWETEGVSEKLRAGLAEWEAAR